MSGVITFLPPAGLFVITVWIVATRDEAGRIDRDYQKATRQALINRADTQHAQIMRGDDEAGTYGIYLPPKGMR